MKWVNITADPATLPPPCVPVIADLGHGIEIACRCGYTWVRALRYVFDANENEWVAEETEPADIAPVAWRRLSKVSTK